jgi:uncharacterized delta-60 repeat protein
MKKILFLFVVTLNTIANCQHNGDIDTTFNNVLSPIGFSGNAINKIVIQPDNKILCAGNNVFSYNGININNFCRLNVNGDLDTIFNQNIGTGPNGSVRDIYLFNNGKIMIVGSFTEVNGIPRTGIARLNSDGSLDLSFSSPTINMTYGIYSIAVQNDGKILIGGSFTQISNITRNAIARLNTDGSLDPSLTSPFAWNDFVKKIDTAANSKIWVLKDNIYRLNNNGTIDGGFNNYLSNHTIKDFIELDNGKILLGGYNHPSASTKHAFIKLMNSNGTYDYSTPGQSGSNGQVFCNTCEVNDFERISLNRILVGGRLNDLGHRNVMIIDDFGNNLDHFIYSDTLTSNIFGNKIQNSNKIITYGQFSHLQNIEVNHIARLEFNDTCFVTGTAFDTTICASSYTSPSGNYIWSVDGVYTDTLINSCGIDSIIEITLSIFNNSVQYFDTISICSGQSYTFPDGTTQNNITTGFDYVSYLTSVLTGCDSIITTTINVVTIDNSTSLNGVTISATETNADDYVWLNCDDNYNQLFQFPFPLSSITASTPGNFAVEITKNGCVDTSNCITITNQDFYNLPNYIPLSAEVFALPVSALGVCDAEVYGYGIGGFPPYYFDWFTQVNNDYSDINDSVCEGIHTLKVIDVIGDSIFVDYYVTDSINWYSWNLNNTNFVDTIYMVTENCNLNLSQPIDSSYISNLFYLYSGNGVNEDYYYLEISYFQTGNQYFYGDTVLLENNGLYLIEFSVFCPQKSVSRIKTILTSFDYISILGIKQVYNDDLNVSVFPNPTNGNVTIILGKENTNSKISIIDITGKILYKKSNINTQTTEFSLMDISSGIYFIKIEIQGRYQILKLIKE